MGIKTRTRFVVGSVCAMAAVGCGASDAGSGGGGDGYVLLDPEARQGGASLEVGDRVVTSALPIAVSAVDRVALVAQGNETRLSVGRGELVYVQGASARVTRLQIGRDVAIDRLHLVGEKDAASALALQVGAKVAEEPEGWTLRTSDVFAASAWAAVPEHLLGAAPVLLNEAAPAIAANAITAPAMDAVTTPLRATGAPASVVAASADVTSHALFTAAAACTGVGGTWRGRVYSDRHQGFYDFTLVVRQHGSSITGSVRAELWSGTTDAVEPPTACGGERHATVVERASGTVSADGAMHFNARSWRVQDHLCGERVTAYSPDKFEVPRASGASDARAVVSDDAVWTDGLPMSLTRVACQ